MTSRTRAKLLKLQKKIYTSLVRESNHALGTQHPSIRKYEREYQSDFSPLPRRLKALDKASILREIDHSQITLIGDVHPFREAQRTALRLIREAIPDANERTKKRWILGLEIFSSQHQIWINRYLAGKLTLEELRKKTEFDERWGFAWPPYAELLSWALVHPVEVLALNQPSELTGSDRLEDRDRWAAGLLIDHIYGLRDRTRQPPAPVQCIVLYGELHIGRKHLPAQIHAVADRLKLKAPRVLSIHQNFDEIYWSLAARGLEQKTQAVRVGRDGICVISSPPWRKLEAILEWIEGSHSPDDDEDPSEDFHFESDSLGWLTHSVEQLCELLNLPMPELARLTVHTLSDADFVDKSRLIEPKSETLLVQWLIGNHYRFYWPRREVAYLGIPSRNYAAELGAFYLLRTHLGGEAMMQAGRDGLFRWALESAFGFFGSLLSNPRRKCDFIEDHLEAISNPSRYSKTDLKARKLAVKILQRQRIRVGPPDGSSWLAGRYVGQILGLKIRDAILSGRVDPTAVLRLVFRRGDGEADCFERRYRELLKLCGPGAVPRSKRRLI